LPKPSARPEWAPPSPESWNLKNGVRVLFLPRQGVPLVSVALVVPRGSETDPADRAGLTQLTADLLDEGAGQRSALELSDALQKLATDVRIQSSTDSVLIAMDLIAENFAPSLQILSDIVRRPRLERAEFNRRKAQVLAQALANESEPRSARREAMYRGLFGKGYAGQVPDGTRRTLEAITYEDVTAHYKRLMAAEGVQFAVAGGIDRASVEQGLEQAFGDWVGKAEVRARPLAAAEPAAIYLVDFPGAAQSALAVMRRAPGSDAGDYFPAAVFSRSFGESFTSRINLNLREDKGYTYGAFSTFVRFRQAGMLGIFADVKTDVTRASVDEVLKELDAVCGSRPLAATERDTSVNGLLLGYPARFESVGL
jgi:zinc protease